MTTLRRLAWTTLLLIGATGCQESASPPPLFLGHVANLSGADGTGKHAEQGIRLALHQLTENQLVDALHGRPLQVRHTDTRGQLDAYEAEAVRLVTINRVIGLIGGTTPDEVVRLDRAQVPVLAVAGVRPPGVSDRVFALGMRPAQQAYVLAKYAAEDLGLQEVVVLADERRDDFLTRAEAFAQAFARARSPKGAIAPPTPLRFGKDAPWEELAKRVAGRAAAVVFAGKAHDWAELRRRLPPALPLIFAGDDGDTAELHGGPAKQPIYLATAFVPDKDAPRAQAFVQQYRAAFNEAPDVAAAVAYEALLLGAEALKPVGPQFTHSGFRDALRAVGEIPGLSGPLTLTKDQFVRRPLYVARLEGTAIALQKRYEPDSLP